MRCYRDVLFIIQHWFKLQPTTSEARKDVVLFTSWTASQKYGEISATLKVEGQKYALGR